MESPVIKTTYVTFESLKIRIARGGNPRGEPVLLLSPLPESLFAFEPAWPQLADDFALLAIDLPGFGRSAGDPSLMNTARMGEFVVRFARELGVSRPHAVGPDIGTPALLSAAAIHPNYFRSLVVGAGATSYPLRVGGLLHDLISVESAEAFADMSIPDLIDGLFAGASYELPRHIRDDYIASYSAGRWASSLAYVRSYPHTLPMLVAQLPAIVTPVQIIAGKRDPFVLPANAEDLHARLPHSRLAMLDAGHLVWEEDAEGYGRIVRQWLKGLREAA